MSARQTALEEVFFDADSAPSFVVPSPSDQLDRPECQDRRHMLHVVPAQATRDADSPGSTAQHQRSFAQNTHKTSEPPLSCMLLSPDASDASTSHESPLVHQTKPCLVSLTALHSPMSATPAKTSGCSLRHNLQQTQQQLQQWQHSRKDQITHAFSQCTLTEQTSLYIPNSADHSSSCSGRAEQPSIQHKKQSYAVQANHTSLHHVSHRSASSKLRQDLGKPRRCSQVLSSQDMNSFQKQANQPWLSAQAAAAGKQGPAAIWRVSTELGALAGHMPDPFAASAFAHSAWGVGDLSPANPSKCPSGSKPGLNWGHEHQGSGWQQPPAAKPVQAASLQALGSVAWPAPAAGAALCTVHRLRHGSSLRNAASEAAVTAARIAAKAEGAGHTSPLCIAFHSKAAQHAEAAVQAASALAALTATASTPAHLCSHRQGVAGIVQAARTGTHNRRHSPASAPASPLQKPKPGRLQRVWHSTTDLLRTQAGCKASSIDVILPQQAAAAQDCPQPSWAGHLDDQLLAQSQRNSSSQLRTAQAEGWGSAAAMRGCASAPTSPGRAFAWQQPSHQDVVASVVGSTALPSLPETPVQILSMGGGSSAAQLAGADQSDTTAKPPGSGSVATNSAVGPMQAFTSTSEHQQLLLHWRNQSNALQTACQREGQHRLSSQRALPLVEDPFQASLHFPLLHDDMCNVDSWRADSASLPAAHRLQPMQDRTCSDALNSTSVHSSPMPLKARKRPAHVNDSLVRTTAAFVTPQRGPELSSLGEREFWAAARADCVDTAEPAERPMYASGVWTPVRQPALATTKPDSHLTTHGITPLLSEHPQPLLHMCLTVLLRLLACTWQH